MAKKNLVKVKALVNLKYDKECVSIDENFKVRTEDATEMSEKGYVELLDEILEENPEGEGELPKEGE